MGNGTWGTIAEATQDTSGVMSATDKAIVDTVAAGTWDFGDEGWSIETVYEFGSEEEYANEQLDTTNATAEDFLNEETDTYDASQEIRVYEFGSEENS